MTSDLPNPMDPGAAASMLRALFAHAQDAVGIVDGGGTVRMANPRLVRMMGYQNESELLGRSLLSMIAPAGQEMIATLIRRWTVDDARSGSYRTRGLRQDGSEMAIEIHTAPYVVDGERHSLSTIREIPEQDGALTSSRSHDAVYRALFDANTAVKLLIDPTTGRILDANQGAIELYGWSLEELLQMRITDINTLTRQEVEEEMENARTGRRRDFRFRHRTASGNVRHVEVHSGPVRLDGQQLLLSIVHDVTERDALEEQLRESQRLELVGRLAGGVAHDFNNLITVMMSSSDMLLRRTEPDSALRPYLEDLAHTARRAADLTRDLLAFSRRQVIEPRPLCLGELVSRMTGLLTRTLGAEYTIECEIEPELPFVLADAGQLEQVVMNLAINARDAMPRGGRLAISARTLHVRHDDTRGIPTGRWVVLEVGDEGEGMDEQTRRQAFEPFFTTKEGTGSGLGLATVHGIVTQNAGYVTVSSRVGRGSVFRVHLPPAPPGEVPADVPDPIVPVADDGSRVLLVDDIEAVRVALARALRHAGFEVIEACSAHEAMSLSDNALRRLDVVVTDVVMSGPSGVDLARALSRRVPDLPIVLISGELRDHHPSDFPEGVHFLAKPFTSEQLAQEIRAALDAHSSSGSDGAPPG